MTVFVGTSGWQYRDWRTSFYPTKLPQGEGLPYFAAWFGAVEVNNTFYRLPRREVFAAWRQRTPPDFVFALKMSRYLTHLRRLRDPEEPVERFLAAAGGLGDKLGPILLQLPPEMPVDAARLDAALRVFPARLRLAVEFRDDSWYCGPVREVLAAHGAALCLADRDEDLVTAEWRTADWGYVRFHWGRAGAGYSDAALSAWAGRIDRFWPEPADVYAFFNNDPQCHAVRDAVRLARDLRALGREVARTPDETEVHVGAYRPPKGRG